MIWCEQAHRRIRVDGGASLRDRLSVHRDLACQDHRAGALSGGREAFLDDKEIKADARHSRKNAKCQMPHVKRRCFCH
jgi:hypothetical protein